MVPAHSLLILATPSLPIFCSCIVPCSFVTNFIRWSFVSNLLLLILLHHCLFAAHSLLIGFSLVVFFAASIPNRCSIVTYTLLLLIHWSIIIMLAAHALLLLTAHHCSFAAHSLLIYYFMLAYFSFKTAMFLDRCSIVAHSLPISCFICFLIVAYLLLHIGLLVAKCFSIVVPFPNAAPSLLYRCFIRWSFDDHSLVIYYCSFLLLHGCLLPGVLLPYAYPLLICSSSLWPLLHRCLLASFIAP